MTTETQQAVPTGTWNADKVHSTVAFAVDYMSGTFQGSFSEFDAKVVDGTLRGSAEVASIQVKDPNLEAHLQTPDFFDAERHPEVRFESSDVSRDGDTLRAEGEITIKGITRPTTLTGTITGPAVDHFGATRVGLELQTTIDRTDFDIKWNMPLPNGEPALSNDVTLKADLTLVEAA